ncbi:adhesion G protein-coupled receptor E3 [Biomphalaria pfeifferi]|uniref:Adhesion G protein-coupled receptor E3 n=1 Tax=Biomphalaria pfeifferi TaxID=112525 RepID=A0AAD8FA31_BIOPF|nr:adhesion G protein-coupled receptor E3 [Biomphalaria pfeifferi]
MPKRVTVLLNTSYNTSLTQGSTKSIHLSWTLTCSFLTFQPTNFTVEWNKDNRIESVNVTLDVGGTKLTISNMSDINSMVLTGNNDLNVCTDILVKYVNKSRSGGTKRPMDGVLYPYAQCPVYLYWHCDTFLMAVALHLEFPVQSSHVSSFSCQDATIDREKL